jgi:tetratricopeptide (TPR) repeat protein
MSRLESVPVKTRLEPRSWPFDHIRNTDWIMAPESKLETPNSRAWADGCSGGVTSKRRSGSRASVFTALAVIGLAGVAWAHHWLGRSAPDIDAIWAQAEAEFMAGRFDRVDTALKRLSRLRRPSPLDHMLRAQYAAACNKPDEALTELALLPDDHFMAAQARLLAGQIELRRDRVRFAEAFFQASLALNPKVVQAHRELIYIYGMQLRRRASNAQFLALSGLVPLSSENVFHWCLLRNNSWEPGEAIASLARYVSADPLDRWSRLALAENERRMGRNDTAESLLECLGPDDSAAVAVRVRIAIDRQDQDRAERLLAEADSNDPALALLRGRLALAKRDAQNAWRHFRIVFKSDPDDHETLLGLVRTLELADQSDAASSFRERARKLEVLSTLVDRAAALKARNDPALLRQLGAACAALNRAPEALAWYELAIALDPLDADAQRAIHQLRDPSRAAHPDLPFLPESISPAVER